MRKRERERLLLVSNLDDNLRKHRESGHNMHTHLHVHSHSSVSFQPG